MTKEGGRMTRMKGERKKAGTNNKKIKKEARKKNKGRGNIKTGMREKKGKEKSERAKE